MTSQPIPNAKKHTNQSSSTMDMDDDFPDLPAPKTNTQICPETPRYNIPTENRFGLLTTPDLPIPEPSTTSKNDNSPNQQSTVPIRLPPIIVTSKILDFAKFNREIRNLVADRYTIRYLNKSINIYAETKQDFYNIQKELKKDNVEYHSFTPKDEREQKFIVKAAPTTDPDLIKTIAENNNLPINNCIQLKSRKTGQPSTSFLIHAPKKTPLQDFKQIQAIDNIRVRWEHYARAAGPSQCHRCQRFGHGSTNCNYPPRCVKCINSHLTKDCTLIKTPTSIAQCCNCLGPHTANYQGCPARAAAVAATSRKSPSTQPRTTPSSARHQVTSDHKPLIQTPTTTTRTVGGSLSYRDALVQNDQNSDNYTDFQTLVHELSELNSICNIKNLINTVRQLKHKLANCKTNMDKLLVLQSLIGEI